VSTSLSCVPLGPDDYERGKKILNAARHPGFVGRELMFRCATRGRVVAAVLDGVDVGIVCVDQKQTLQTLSVIAAAQGRGVGGALVLHVRPFAAWVKAIEAKVPFFERLGYARHGAAEIGQSGKMATQLMRRTADVLEQRSDLAESVIAVRPVQAPETKAEQRVREAAEREEREREAERSREGLAGLPIATLIPRLQPELTTSVDHLAPWTSRLERAAKGVGVRAMCAEPIRHFKSTTTYHGIVHALLNDPTLPVVFFTHSAERALTVGKKIRALAEACDKTFATRIGPVKGDDRIQDWKNERGGGVVVMSAAQSRLGYDCGMLVADDPLDEYGANDIKVRDAVDDAIIHYTARCMRKGQPGPVLLIMSRWHVDDPIGRRLQRQAQAWDYIHGSAILNVDTNEEAAFAPTVWPLEELRKVRRELAERDPTERLFWAQFQNEPRPPGADLFGPPARYDEIPKEDAGRVVYGADLAFTQGDKADYFALVAARLVGDRLFLLDAVRERLGAHMIEAATRRMQARYGEGPIYSYVSGPEVGFVRLMAERGLRFVAMRARYNKLVRAERTIHRWNHERLLTPTNATWAPGFLHRVTCWRGLESDGDDDEVDALVSLSDGAMGSPAAGMIQSFGRSYQGFWCAGARPGRA
jgi:hypothetical protein